MKSTINKLRTLIAVYLARDPVNQVSKILTTQLERGDDLWDRCNWTGHLTASAVLLDEATSSVLVIKHVALNRLLLPGGHCDPYEMPYESASRELIEETGITDSAIHPWHLKNDFVPIDIDTHRIPQNASKREPAHFHHDFRYVFIHNCHSPIKIDELEISEALFCSTEWLKADYPGVHATLGSL